MPDRRDLPGGLELSRATDMFDNDTVPAGLLRAHRVADGVWARLVVHAGAIRFVFEDDADETIEVGAGDHIVIPPSRPRHVELLESARFALEFHRPHSPSRKRAADDGSAESMGLSPT